ncbi:FkbM family methyltransferase [Bosea vestrisii]|uniref:FkbM family methyltransferase n=1 Tax=Bosea vestrisii TaxID=151416 RepID=UPI0024DFBD6A|nr:FkbM family methyltransferase [Bosea vestrisii]WID96880.1 FkbM family methyltransferase [Bosea vestrisii]
MALAQSAIAFDRPAGRLVAGGMGTRALVGALDAYGALSRPLQQRGLYKACRLIGSVAWSGRTATIALGSDAQISFPASDPYWNRMLLRSYDHEPEMARLLRLLAGVDYGFVDCGANIGYWSVFAASSVGGGKPVLAVEASAPTYGHLVANAAPHAGLIKTFHRAILDRSGVEVNLNAEAHEARGIAAEGEASNGETVISISIDDLLEQQGWTERRLIVKLDVEGVEREALGGMERALGRDALVIYEDHGSDPIHALTRHILEERGLAVHLLLDDRIVPLARAAELDAYKRDRTKGYNLIALRNARQWPGVAA